MLMDSLIFAIEAVAPIIIMLSVGYILKKLGLMSEDFAKAANKLVFRVLLPIKLFMNIYNMEKQSLDSFWYIVYALGALIAVFCLALPAVSFLTDKKNCRGALLQGIFRSNYALIGIPLAGSLFGQEGESVATLLSAFLVPAFNMLAVLGLSIFNNTGEKANFKKVLMGIVKNPLIIGIALGLVSLGVRELLISLDIGFRLREITVLWNPMKDIAGVATPLALLVLGAQFEFSAIPHLKKEILAGTVLRSVIVPLLCVGTAFLAFRNSFTGAEFAALVAAFCTPVAVSSVPMAQEMGADASLAGQLVVFTTITSAFTVFTASFLLKLAGIF